MAVHEKAYPPAEQGPWQWDAPQEAKELLESLDGHAGLRSGLRRIASVNNEWAGIPMPLDGERLIIDRKYPFADGLMKIGMAEVNHEEGVPDSAKLGNCFWSWYRRSLVQIWTEGGKTHWGLIPGVHNFSQQLRTLGCCDAWSIEAEHCVLKTLAELVSHRQFKQYLLTGSFIETSKRSRVSYMFRKLRPTIAIGQKDGELRILCALCLHAVAYYAGSHAGAMVPTDDVVAHLMLMRVDEKMFWRRANQHAAYRPESGIQ